MTDALSELKQLVEPPVRPVCATSASFSWDEVEAATGLSLPEDYKNIINTYGNGSFGGYVIFYNPFVYASAQEFRGRLTMLADIVNANRSQFPDSYPPIDFYPQGNAVMIGCTDSSGSISLLREGESYSVVTTDADFSPNFGYSKVGLARFLLDWIEGRSAPYGFSTINAKNRKRFIPESVQVSHPV